MLSKDISEKINELKKHDSETGEIITALQEDHDAFLSGISHELKNILTIMSSSLQLLESSHPEIIDYRYWKETKEDCNFLQSIIYQMSDYNNSARLNTKKTNLAQLIRNTYISCLALTESTNKSLSYNCYNDIPEMYVDRTKIYEAVLNLVKNAIEAVNDNGHIIVELKRQESNVSISVTDDGNGIKPDQVERIFEPFNTTKKEGTGLGLPLSKKIVEAHNGTLSVISVPGEGTSFTITLPLDSINAHEAL
ncbi:MAG: sensor histidine kinase [Lachnospiraceae bacterium]